MWCLIFNNIGIGRRLAAIIIISNNFFRRFERARLVFYQLRGETLSTQKKGIAWRKRSVSQLVRHLRGETLNVIPIVRNIGTRNMCKIQAGINHFCHDFSIPNLRFPDPSSAHSFSGHIPFFHFLYNTFLFFSLIWATLLMVFFVKKPSWNFI